jgi:hypothetical protein
MKNLAPILVLVFAFTLTTKSQKKESIKDGNLLLSNKQR